MCQLSTLINKKILPIIILLIIVCTNVYAMPSPTLDFYVNDFASLLSESTKEYIINVNTSLESQTGAQVVIVTVPNLQGESLEQYATDMFRAYGIGNSTKNNGVLLLLALEERQFGIEVGYGLEGVLNDGKTGEIQDLYVIPHLRVGNWDKGIKNGFDAIVKEVCNEYQISVTSEQPVQVDNGVVDMTDLKQHGWLGYVGLVLGAVIGICKKVKSISGSKTFLYILLGYVLSIGLSWLLLKNIILVMMFAIVNLIGIIFAFVVTSIKLSIGSNTNHYGSRHYNSRNDSGGHSSESRTYYHGGGGRSGGGGSSRGF